MVGDSMFDSPLPRLSCMCRVMKAIRVRSTTECRQSSSRRAALSNARTAGAHAIVSNLLRPRRSEGRHAFAISCSRVMTWLGLLAGWSLASANSHAMGLTSIPRGVSAQYCCDERTVAPTTERVENGFIRLREVGNRVMDKGLREHSVVSPESIPSPSGGVLTPNILGR